LDKINSRWRSERLHRDTQLVRWGHAGRPVLILPTAAGDAEEIERFHVLDVLAPLVDGGKIRVYSCDSVAGRIMVEQEGTPQHRMWALNQFHHYIRREVVPAIHKDCQDEGAEIIASGASIGAFHAVALVCRFPDVFAQALALSGTYKIERFMGSQDVTREFRVSSPLRFLPQLEGPHLEKLRTRFILIASGQGRAEDISESWLMARALGDRGIPNRMDPWGPEWHHDWITWRYQWPGYLKEWCG